MAVIEQQSPARVDPAPTEAPPQSGPNRGLMIGLAVGALVVVALIVWAVIAMLGNPGTTETLRDVFIIFMALEGLIIGVALVVMIVQLALLTNLLRHEVKPILDSTNEAARTLRGTAEFVSQNMVDPIIRAQSSFAAVRGVLDALRPNNRR
jgi:hypothetical protein